MAANGAVEDPTNLLHRLRQFMRTLSPVPPKSSASPSYLEKDLATCSHVYLQCDRVRQPLEPPYDGPFRVLSRGPKAFRIQRDNREEVVSVGRLKAAVPGTPPDEPCGPLPSASPHAASLPPSRIFPLPSCPLPPTVTTNSNTSATRCLHSSTDPVYITRSGRHVHFPDRGLVSSLPDFWQHAPELYFFRIEATFHSAKITRETDKYYKLVDALPPTILSQVQTFLRDPPTNAPYAKLKAELVCLTSVSDQQRYHALVKEEALGDRKLPELLRLMRSLAGNLTIDDKFFKEMFLERLPTSVQAILASGSDDLDISKLAEMADRMMEVERLSSPTIAQVSQPLTVSTSDLAELKTHITQLSATVTALQQRRSPGPSRRPFGRDRRRSRSRQPMLLSCQLWR
ncbi:hypothetical protein SprV_0401527500 [Sparganum proliferum]